MALSKLVYDRKGSGEPVVLIHGIGHRRQAWYPVFDKLAERYDVIALDLAGFGESPSYAKGTSYGMDNACQDLAENFAEWGIDQPHVVGNSLGGAIALELGARGLASSVTALSPAGFFSRGDLPRALGILGTLRLLSQAPDAVIRGLAHTSVGRRLIGSVLYAHPERHGFEMAYGDALALKRCKGFMGVARAGHGYQFDSPIDVPTTIAWGTKDLILPYRQASLAAERLPYARHLPLHGAGHVPMIDEPDLIIRLIDETVAAADLGVAGVA
jgi:pimeloyl-ACP methyl ester carboxylesterase